MPIGLHLDLDGAWDAAALESAFAGLTTLECREWGPPLRFTAPRAAMERFYEAVLPRLRPYLLYGSGDYHHLAALWLRRFREPVSVVSFDNHPDWDTRPPHWCCGNWVSRALELPHVERIAVWGCGNFELEWPHRLFGNRAGVRSGRLALYPWGERLKEATRAHWPVLTRENWRERFLQRLGTLGQRKVYVTVDIDCLQRGEAATNWENGLFSVDDLCWALGRLHTGAEVIGGDLCGAYSPPVYARWRQRIAGRFDHPRLPDMDVAAEKERNFRSLRALWPALTGRPVPVETLTPVFAEADQRGAYA